MSKDDKVRRSYIAEFSDGTARHINSTVRIHNGAFQVKYTNKYGKPDVVDGFSKDITEAKASVNRVIRNLQKTDFGGPQAQSIESHEVVTPVGTILP